MLKVLIVSLVLIGCAAGQELKSCCARCATTAPGYECSPKTSGTVTATTSTTVGVPIYQMAAKHCAFGLTPKLLPGTGKSKPPTVKEIFDVDQAPLSTWAVMRYRESCPYERAIELFGEDRVSFEEVGGAPPVKRVLVDGESVYEEKRAAAKEK